MVQKTGIYDSRAIYKKSYKLLIGRYKINLNLKYMLIKAKYCTVDSSYWPLVNPSVDKSCLKCICDVVEEAGNDC